MFKYKDCLFLFTLILFICTALFVLQADDSVYAQDTEEIILLREKVADLEGRIKDLEGLLHRYNLQDKLQNSGEFGWENKKNWRMLKPGMTLEQVQELLGAPVKEIEGVTTLWYYPNIYCGYVSFDENGHVSGWSEP